jgi:hypothetical protein
MKMAGMAPLVSEMAPLEPMALMVAAASGQTFRTPAVVPLIQTIVPATGVAGSLTPLVPSAPVTTLKPSVSCAASARTLPAAATSELTTKRGMASPDCSMLATVTFFCS